MTDTTAPARNAAMRQRRKDAGLVLVRVYVPADRVAAVKAAIAEAIAPVETGPDLR